VSESSLSVLLAEIHPRKSSINNQLIKKKNPKQKKDDTKSKKVYCRNEKKTCLI